MTSEHKVARAALGLPELVEIVHGPQERLKHARHLMHLLSLAADTSSDVQALAYYEVSFARGIDRDDMERGRLIMNLVDDYEGEE